MGNSFDDRAATWDENPRRINLVDNVWGVLNEELNFEAISSVLDYGCGTGLLGYKTIDQVDRITFCDTSQPMLNQVEKKREYYGYQNVNTLCADLTQDRIPNEKFDLILSMLVLHHVEHIEKIIEVFYQLSSEGGKFVWIDLDQEDGSFHLHDESIPHHGFSKNTIKSILEKVGYEMVFYTHELRILKEIDGDFKAFPLFVMVAEKK